VSLGEGAFDEANDPLAMVEGGVFGEEASSCWRDVGVTKICEDVDGCGGVVVVLDYAYGEFVGRALETEGDGHLGGVMVVCSQSRTMGDYDLNDCMITCQKPRKVVHKSRRKGHRRAKPLAPRKFSQHLRSSA